MKKKATAIALAGTLLFGLFAPAAPALAATPETAAADDTVALVASAPEETVTNLDLPDSNDLFAQYAQRVFYGADSAAPLGNYGETYFTGTSLTVYHKLKEHFAQVANGEKENAVFATVLRWEDLPQTSWTAEELGVTDLSSAEAKEAVYGIIGYNPESLKEIMGCLMYDCPYDLYWFDKTVGFSYSPGCNLMLGEENGTEVLSLGLTQIMVRPAVIENYAPENPADISAVDTTKTGAAKAAAQRAQQIVTDHENEGDYDKLCAYLDEICALTEYNYEAAAGGINYGDPWQLIYVFDEDPTTKVVCEGYAKAFQYLCDLSRFAQDINSYIIVGEMGRVQGSLGGHMWNHVVMPDGESYLVDVTNSDTGMVGARGGLFLAGGTFSDLYGGYIIPTQVDMLYTYDSEVYRLYEADILNLADKPYDPTMAATPTPAPTATPTPTPTATPTPTPTATPTPGKPGGEITSDVYPIQDGAMTVEKPTNAATLLAGVHGEDLRLTNADGEPLRGEDLVGTGTTVAQGDGPAELVIVVYGDLNGDGKIAVGDLLEMRRALLALTKLDGVWLRAATADSGEPEPNVRNILQLSRVLLNLTDSMKG